MSGLIDKLDIFAVTPDMAYQTAATSTLGSQEPILSNMLAHRFKFSRDDDYARTWAWTLSEPMLTLGHDDLAVSGWVLIAWSLTALYPKLAAVYVLELFTSILFSRQLTCQYFFLVGGVLAARLLLIN